MFLIDCAFKHTPIKRNTASPNISVYITNSFLTCLLCHAYYLYCFGECFITSQEMLKYSLNEEDEEFLKIQNEKRTSSYNNWQGLFFRV